MKKFVFLFLILTMLMPGLACAMPVCITKEKPAIEKPCHSHEKTLKKVSDLRFVVDCMGVDLQKAEPLSFEKANIQPTPIDLPYIRDEAISQALLQGPYIIRGPPAEWSRLEQGHSPIILKTQRFRI